jgi:diguanylate cyclase (GGDEF)-like protein
MQQGSKRALADKLDFLYVGSHYRREVEEMASDAVALVPMRSVFEALFRVKREEVQGVLVELPEIAGDLERAMATLRSAAGRKRVLVLMSPDEAERQRSAGLVEPEEMLVCPFYPNELWKRLHRHRAPAEQAAISRFGSDADRLAALIEDTRLLNRLTSDLEALGEKFVERVTDRVGARKVSLFLREPGGEEMPLIHAVGLPPDVIGQARIVPGRGVAGRLLVERRAVLVREAGEDGPASKRTYQSGSYMIVPQMWQGDVLGVLCVTERIRPGPFRDKDLAYLEAFSESAAQTLHNASLLRTADELATIDELTGLFNRRYFNHILPKEIVRARRYRHDMTLAMLDVDRFKLYNDTNGHQAGDRVLREIAKILKESFREADIVVRYGGEEFAVIMPETTRLPGNGVDFVDRARRRVEEADIRFNAAGAPPRVTISGGVASFPAQAKDDHELVERADASLFEAKRRGRNRIVGA